MVFDYWSLFRSVFFFFQAEDGIRDTSVTGVQTCALPISLVEKIAALFKGKNAHVSTVAIGSTYERPVLQGLAAALGGTFTHVEGAADVHAEIGRASCRERV